MNLTSEPRKLYLLIFFITACNFLSAQPGKPDSSFVNNGVFYPPVAGVMAVQPDGKIICARYRLARYNTNGTFDSSFANNGVASLDSGTSNFHSPSIIKLQADGKIILVGGENPYTRIPFAITRYLPNGNLDSSFDADGRLPLNFLPSNVSFSNAAIQKDGKIILAGTQYYQNPNGPSLNNTFFLLRINRDGKLDNSFGLNGFVNTEFNGDAKANSLVLQDDGKIIAAGESLFFNLYPWYRFDSLVIARYNYDGSLDYSFNGNGKFSWNEPNYSGYSNGSHAKSVLLQPDGKIIIGGECHFTQSHGRWVRGDFALWRLMPNGKLDSSFNGTGISKIRNKGNIEASRLSLQSDDKILIAGNYGDTDFTTYISILVARVNNNGSIDSSFGANGAIEIIQGNLSPDIGLDKHRIYISGNIRSYPYPNAIFAFQNDGIPMSPFSRTQCPLASNIIFKSDLQGNTYQWQLSTDSVVFTNITNNANYSGTNDSVLHLMNIPSAWYGYRYRCIVDNGISNFVTIKFSNEWTGAISNVWEDPANWLCGAVPDINTDVIINSGTVLLSSNTSIRSLMIKPGVSFNIAAGYHLTLTH